MMLYLAIPLCSAYHAVIFSSHISAVIWYCIRTWGRQTGFYRRTDGQTDRRTDGQTDRHLPFEATAHLGLRTQACGSLGHNPHTAIIEKKEKRFGKKKKWLQRHSKTTKTDLKYLMSQWYLIVQSRKDFHKVSFASVGATYLGLDSVGRQQNRGFGRAEDLFIQNLFLHLSNVMCQSQSEQGKNTLTLHFHLLSSLDANSHVNVLLWGETLQCDQNKLS